MNVLETIYSVWHSVVFVSEWTGLSVGALAGLAALFYFVPLARKLAIQGAILVVVAWACLMHGHLVGVSDEAAKLQILSTLDDNRDATEAAADDKARAADIESKASKQHEQDLAEIERLKTAGDGCAFDPGPDGVQPSAGILAKPVSNKAKPTSLAKPTHKSTTGPKAGQGLQLPVGWPSWLQGKGHSSNAPSDGK